MPATTRRDMKLVEYLNDAYATERRLEIALQAHIVMTPRRDYKARLREHLKETKAHARAVARRITQLGGHAETASVPGLEPLAAGVRVAQAAAQQAVAVAQGPLHAIRGTSAEERMLKNARTEFQDEAEEIATYRAIEALSRAVGDTDTAKLAREIQRDEERMSDFLGDIIDQLAIDVVQEAVPESEIISVTARAGSGGSAGRTSARSRSAGSTRSGTGTTAKSGGSRSSAASKSGSSRSAAAKSGGSRSSAASKSGSSRSAAAKSGGSRSSAASKSGSSRSASTKSDGSRSSAASKSGSSRSASTKSDGARSSAAKSGGSRSSAVKSGGSRSSAAKSGGSRSSAASKSGGSRSKSAAKSAGSRSGARGRAKRS
jgi:ferritin-like metal-binding protein YciE